MSSTWDFYYTEYQKIEFLKYRVRPRKLSYFTTFDCVSASPFSLMRTVFLTCITDQLDYSFYGDYIQLYSTVF